MRHSIQTGLFLGAGTLLLNLDSAQAQSADPADFADNLRPRYWVGDEETRFTLQDRMAELGVAGVGVAIIDDGEIVWSGGQGVLQAGGGEAVNDETVFSAGSVSKVATASLILRLQAEGMLDIDTPVTQQVTSWTLPEDPEFSTERVTLRMILSHTAGFNLHGFGDFPPNVTNLPTVYDTLNGVQPANHVGLALTSEPGTAYRYSGGGYTLAQLIVSDVTGMSFEEAAETYLFAPAGMSRSSFANPLPEDHGNIARAHGRTGTPIHLPRGYESMPEMAASGLWTSADDLGGLVVALLDSYRGEGDLLAQSDAVDMMTRIAPSQHGLGPRIEGRGEHFFFHHAGTNNSYHAWMEGHPATGDGLVVLINGAGGGDLHREIRNAVSDVMGWEINRPVRVPEIALDAEHLESFVGVYATDAAYPGAHRQQMVRSFFDQDLDIRVEDGALTGGVVGRDFRLPLLALTPNRFLLTGLEMREGIPEIEFHRNAEGVTEGVTFRLANASSYYQRR